MKKEIISLDKEESTAIKGLLIFLIILGHNSILTGSITGLFHYLYTFHVQAFFILPFFYNTKGINFKKSFKKNFFKLYYPFILMFIALSIVNYITSTTYGSDALIQLNSLSPFEKILYYINTLITGNFYLIDYFTGFQFLWFLPVMFSMMVIKNYFTTITKKSIKVSLLIVGCIFYILFFVFMYYKPYETEVNFKLMLLSPFAIMQGLGALFLGYICKFTMSNKNILIINICSIIIFVTLSIIYAYYTHYNMMPKSFLYLMRFIMPFLFINLLYFIKQKISKINSLKKIGKQSFSIYLIHVPISTVLYMVCNKFFSITITYGIIAQIIILAISYSMSIFIDKHHNIKKLIFPNDINDFKR